MAVFNIPFVVKESIALTEGVISLFDRSFHASPPDFPRHFVALEAMQPSKVAAYVHFTAAEAGVFLLGGLCVDGSSYRRLDHQQRGAIAAEGSLSRWLMRRSIELLKPARAIFGYTGDVRSRRDITALGFVIAVEPYLFVQWHDEPVQNRDALIGRIARLGPF